MITLRDYQVDILASLKDSFLQGNRRVVMCAPTGAGKTIMFCKMVSDHVARGGKALILTDRIELLKQASGSFAKFGLDPEEIKAGHVPDLTADLHVAMVETLSRRADKYETFIKGRTLVIIDESHRTAFNKLFPYFGDKAFVIGAKATPHRQGNQASMDEFYTDIVQPVDTVDLVERGFLSSARSFGVPTDLTGIKKKGGDFDTKEVGNRFTQNKIYDGVLENYNRITPNSKALIFASSIESSEELVRNLVLGGKEARHLDSFMSKTEREETLAWFNKTKTGMLSNVGILTTGFDQPDITTVILYRATTSLPLMLQMVGRGSRTTETKTSFTILDFGSNLSRLGLWEEERVWGLEKQKKGSKEDAGSVKSCLKCAALVPISTPKCEYCGYVFVKSKKEIEQAEVAVLEALPKSKRMQMATEGSIDQKVKMCKMKLVHPYWVIHQMTDKNEAIEFCKKMGYKQGFIHFNKQKFQVFM